MKLITYMMQYLTSILSTETSKETESSKRIDALEKRIKDLEQNIQELAFCIQQMAATVGTLITHTAKQTDSVSSADDYLDSLLKDDDDGSGYLH